MFLVNFLIIGCSAFTEETTGVWVLNSSELDEALDAQSGLMVEFYSPSCGHCSTFAPEYARIGEFLNKNGLFVAKIDGSQNSGLLSKYSITHYPTLLYFIDGINILYEGPRNFDAVTDWIKDRKQKPYRKISTQSEMDSVKNEKMAVVYVGELENELRKTYDKAYLKINDIDFYLLNSTSNLELYNSTEPLVFFFSYNEGYNMTLTTTVEDLLKFIEHHRPPKVYEWSENMLKLILDYKTCSCIFLFDQTDEEKEKYLPVIQTLSEKYHEKLLFTYTSIENTEKRFNDIVGIRPENQPIVLILDNTKNLRKYRTSNVNYEDVSAFIEKWMVGEVYKYLKSEPLPSIEYEKRIKILTGDTFINFISNTNITRVVTFYQGSSLDSLAFIDILERVAYEASKKWKNIVFSKLEVDNNELDNVKLDTMPSLRVYPKSHRSSLVFDMKGGKFGVMDFIRRHVAKDDL